MVFAKRMLKYQLKTMLQEYAFLENDEGTFVKLYEVADPEEKNLLAEMFWQMLQKQASYDIQKNLGQGPKLGENLQAFIDMHELYLKDFGGAKPYLQKLKGSIADRQSKK
eukprot:Gb_31338 [translate_table: standard]